MSRLALVRLVLVASSVLALAPLASAQLTWGGVPVSQQVPLSGDVPTVEMEPVDVPTYLAEDAQAGPGTPGRFGAMLPADLGFEHGVWDVAPDGTRVWRLRLESPGAYSLGLLFSRYTLPGGSSLFVYGDGWADLCGAFDDRNNKDDGEFSIVPVPGDAITLEYVEPAAVAASGQSARLRIAAVVHDYRDLYALLDGGEAGAGPADGACDVDVMCEVGAGWQDEKRAVVLMLIGGSYCTGALINNTAHDGTQYLITAQHCGGLNNAIFRFGFEKPACASGVAPTTNTVQGSVLVMTDAYDYRLVRLTSPIPASFEPYFLGWDRSGVAPAGAVTIHHGAKQAKKISIDNDPVTNFGGSWHVDQWDVGTIHGGSSGGPLMPSSGRFIGQLSLGVAGCATPVDSYFNCLHLAWPDLEAWLDPAGTGELAIDALDPYGTPVLPVLDGLSPATVQVYQGGTFTLTGTDLAGVTQVNVGDVAVTSGFTATPTSVTVLAPDADTLGLARVTVTGSGGTSAGQYLTYVETSPPKLTNTGSFNAPVGGALGGEAWPFTWAAGSNDTVLLVYSFAPDTFEHAGYPILSDFAIGAVQTLPANGIGGMTVRTPEGFVFVSVWTQVLSLHGTGGFAGASNIAKTVLVP